MGYYSMRILRSFRGGVLSKGWTFVSVAVPFLIFGQLVNGFGSSQSLTMVSQETLRVIGASLSAIGGLLIVLGFRAQYKAWNPKGMKRREASAPETSPIST
jgi:hypothetical protein